jgi:hypothetical protein
MNLENYAKMRGLQQASSFQGSHLTDHILSSDQADEFREKILPKRLQFDTTQALYSQVESICNLLNCSKREFLEMAVSEAIDKAEDIFMKAFKDGSGRDFMDVFGVKES